MARDFGIKPFATIETAKVDEAGEDDEAYDGGNHCGDGDGDGTVIQHVRTGCGRVRGRRTDRRDLNFGLGRCGTRLWNHVEPFSVNWLGQDVVQKKELKLKFLCGRRGVTEIEKEERLEESLGYLENVTPLMLQQWDPER